MSKVKLALKRLAASDLTLFEWHFRHRNAGNQKAINLNRNVFIDELYPALPEAAAEQEGRLPLNLTILGPNGAGAVNLQRKIIKFGSYKNWRLNGEFIYNPQNEPDRFNELRADDLALFEFSGRVAPTSARMVLLGAKYSSDVDLHKALVGRLGGAKMISLTQDELTRLIDEANAPLQHPIRLLAIDEIVEDAAQGGAAGLERLWTGVARQKLSSEALEKARRNAEDIGRLGEELVNAHLGSALAAGNIEELEWTSAENAVAPYDFKMREKGVAVLLDVKSTAGDFGRSLHISMNEVRQMANGVDRYDIWRIYAINGSEAKARIAADIGHFGKSLLDALHLLPQGVTPDGFSVDPKRLPFGPEMVIRGPEEDD